MKINFIITCLLLACMPAGLFGQELKFEVKYKGEVLQNEQVIEIREYEMQGDDMVMMFDPQVTNISSSTYGMILMKEETALLANTQSTVCWDQCMSADVPYAISEAIAPGVTQNPYGDLVINYQGEPVIGTSVIKYTFMTNDPEDASLWVEVNFIYEGPATMQREGSVLTLEGPWKISNFEALDLSDASLTALDMSGITIPDEAPALNPANPNLLIYISGQANVPAKWSNVIKGDLAENISLTDGYSFQNLREFKASSISYKREFTDKVWTTGCLPFEVAELPQGIKAEQIYELLKTDIRFKDTTALAANTPYIFCAETSGSFTFEAADITVPLTRTDTIRLENYAFTGNFTPMEITQETDTFLLNNDGSAFEKATQAGKLDPFRAYIGLIQPDEELLNIGVAHGESGIKEHLATEGAPYVRAEEGRLIIRTTEKQTVRIFGTDGSLQRELILSPGVHQINDLNKGVYIVDKKKIVL